MPTRPLRLHGDEAAQRALAESLAAAPDFASAPCLEDHAAETGTWTRVKDVGLATPQNVWMRLASRLTDLAQLASADGARWLVHGDLAVRPGEGLAWTETARGLLVHWVRLDGPRVTDCRVLAPTDWNFHPRGVVAQALSTLPEACADHEGAGAPNAAAAWLVATFDPCVAHDWRAARTVSTCAEGAAHA
jgi:Ni,Fe-hydrogenase I large subunit